jgi:ABC-type glycerol-3-phosphate transport system substrate-binding protein
VVRLTLVVLILPIVLALGGCSSPAPQATTKQGPVEVTGPASTTSKHPLAKYIELAGFRLAESKPGELEVKFVAINHSEADLGDLGLTIRLKTTAAKPDDPPVAEFMAKVASLGPLEIRDISAKVSTKLRIYELPDWQFMRAEFDITSPAP